MSAQKRKWISAFLFAFICVDSQPAFADDASDVGGELKTLIGVYSALEQEGAERPNAALGFYQGAIPAMLRALDPHSNFFDPDQYHQLQQSQRSESQGFGMVVSILPGRVLVLQSLEGTPAARVGITGGDEMIAINGYELAYLDVEQITGLIGTARQKQAALHFRHAGETRVVDATMSPDLLEESTVSHAFEIAPDIAYLRVVNFEEVTGNLIRSEIERLGGEYLRGLILDLRGNPGGAVSAALDTASLFLAPDQLVFSIKGRHMDAEDAYVPRSSKPFTFPVMVLMNGMSASASEIVAGALQDHDRAVILGEPSYGKGLVQQVFPLSNGTGITLTVAFYYTPSGRSIQKPLSGGQLDSATRVTKGPFRSDSGRTLAGGGGIQPDKLIFATPRSWMQVVLDATGLLTAFAGQYVRAGGPVLETDVPGALPDSLMDQLRQFLKENNVEPGDEEWRASRQWIGERLTEEILTIGFGVARGDKIRLPNDPVVREALRQLRGGL